MSFQTAVRAATSTVVQTTFLFIFLPASTIVAGVEPSSNSSISPVRAKDECRAQVNPTGGPVEARPDAWPQWRGPNRDGRVKRLPATLPAKAEFAWEKPLESKGVGGIAADDRLVVVSGRDLADGRDVFLGLDPATGAEKWTVDYKTIAELTLDYGNSPRATPLFHDRFVFLLGAFGRLSCVDRDSGDVVWKRDLRKDFSVEDKLVWGHASSPLVVAGKLIVNPGGADASIVALEPATGKLIWKCAGEPASFSSFVVAGPVDSPRIIGFDKTSLGVWNALSGVRITKITPPNPRDFNVPTPIVWKRNVVVCTENNGTRIHPFDARGGLADKPTAESFDVAPDTHSPVVVGDLLFGVHGGLVGLDVANGLRKVGSLDDRAFRSYASLIASPDRLLALTVEGELILIDVAKQPFKIASRLKLFDDEKGVFSHPALVGRALYVRGGSSIVRINLPSD